MGCGKPLHSRRCCQAFLSLNSLGLIWCSMIAGVFVQFAAGTLYGVGSFSPELRHQLNYTGTEMSSALALGDVGLYLGVSMGILNDLHGPTAVLVVSGVLIMLGYGLAYAALLGAFQMPWPLFAFLLILVGQGSYGGFSAGYATTTSNFPEEHRGVVVGIQSGAFAASSAIFAQIFDRVLFGDIQSLFLLFTTFCGGMMLVGTFFMWRLSHRIDPSLGETIESTTKLLSVADDDMPDLPLTMDYDESVTGLRMIKQMDFWLLFAFHFLVTSCGLVWINNQGEMAKSIGLGDVKGTLISVLAVGSIGGRVGLGFLSDRLAHRISRAWWIVLVALIMMAMHISYAFVQTRASLIAGSLLSGFAYGSDFCLVLAVQTILFGTKYAGTNAGIFSVAPAIGGFLFNLLAGKLYDNGADTSTLVCLGHQCFQAIFFVTAGASLLAVILGLWFVKRLKSFQNKRKFKTLSE